MDKIYYETIEEMLADLEVYKSIHIECGREASEKIFEAIGRLKDKYQIGCVIGTDKGYEREKVKSYLRFFRELHGCRGRLFTGRRRSCIDRSRKKRRKPRKTAASVY